MKHVSSVAVLLAAIILLGNPPLTHAQTTACPWPMYGQNARNMGTSPHFGPSGTLKIKWSSPLWKNAASTVMGPGGRLYVGSMNGLYAVDRSGAVQWIFTGVLSNITSTPAIDDQGTVYVGSGAYLFALNPDGTEKWRVQTGWHIISPPTLGENGMVYVGDRDGHVYAVDPGAAPADRMIWKSEHIGHVDHGAPAISQDGGTLYLTSRLPGDSRTGAISALDVKTGRLKWQVSTPGGIMLYSSPALGPDGTIYITSRNSYLYALNPDGTEKWTFKTAGAIDATPAIAEDGTVYFGSTDGHLYSVTPEGSLRWKIYTGPVTSMAAVDKNGAVYVAAARQVYAINPDGTQKWSISLGRRGNIHDTPVIDADGSLYVATSGMYGRLYALKGSNNAPMADAGPNLGMESYEAEDAIVSGTASDADPGDTLRCRWTEGERVLLDWISASENGACNLPLQGRNLQTGTHTLTLSVSDGQAEATDSMVLTIGNSAPSAVASGGGTYEIFTPVVLGGEVSDYDGDTLTYEWLDGERALFRGQVQAPYGNTPVQLPVEVLYELPLGAHRLTLSVDDGVNAAVTSSAAVTIIDGTAPILQPVVDTTILWPPNHKMVDIAIEVNAADNSGEPVRLSAVVASNEPIAGRDRGDRSPDWTEPVIDQDRGIVTLKLRAERSGSGVGRSYFVTVKAEDRSGNASEAMVTILVPHDQRGSRIVQRSRH